MNKQKLFFEKYANDAMECQNLFGVPASITLAQAALESGWGTSSLTVMANNFFGIKADKSWRGDKILKPTIEYYNGVKTNVNSYFRKYATAKDSFIDHAKFLMKWSRYDILFDNMDSKEWAKELQQAGYATDPNYANKLINLIAQYNLTAYDIEAPKKKIAKLLFICVLTTGASLGISYYKKWLKTPQNWGLAILTGIASGVIINASINFYNQKKY
jgi:flagellum-specific peptidoglycan hydrolase FlgJ